MTSKRNMRRRKSKRSFETVPDGVPAVRVEKTPVDVAAKIRKRIREEVPDLAKRLNAREYKFITELYFGDCGVIQYKAYKAAFKKPEMSNLLASQSASRLMRSIRSKIGEEGIHEIIGFTLDKADCTVLGLLDAEYKREFVTRDGRIVEGGTYPNFLARSKGVEFLYKRKGVYKDDDRTQVPIVNIISYNPPGTPTFPGGGRDGASIAVNMIPAALPAPDGALGEPRNQR